MFFDPTAGADPRAVGEFLRKMASNPHHAAEVHGARAKRLRPDVFVRQTKSRCLFDNLALFIEGFASLTFNKVKRGTELSPNFGDGIRRQRFELAI